MKKIFFLSFVILLGCSEGFKTAELPKDPIHDQLNDKELKAYIQTGPFEGRQVLNNIQDSKLQVWLPAGLNSFLPIGSFATADNQISGSVISDNFGFKTLRFLVPARWISQGVNLPSVTQFPNGEDLTLFPGGRASHLALSLDSQGQNTLNLYFSPPYFAAFIQTPFDQGESRQYPVTYGTTFLEMGRFSTHPHHAPLNGGLLLFISLPQ